MIIDEGFIEHISADRKKRLGEQEEDNKPQFKESKKETKNKIVE